MKLMISKNKEGNGYYSKIQNDYNGKHTEKYLNIQLPKDTELEYGLYDVDGFLSTYTKKDGNTEFKFIITKYTKTKKEEPKEEKTVKEQTTEVFEEFGKEIDLSEELPF